MKEIREALAFDDVMMVPTYTEVSSRSIPDLSTNIAGISLKIPIISSPMDCVTESGMAILLGRLGGIGIIHRFMSPEDQIANLSCVAVVEEFHNRKIPKVAAIGVGLDELDRFRKLNDAIELDAIAIDIANGHSLFMREMIGRVKEISKDIRVIAGNVATGKGFTYLAESGANAIRVAIGGGSICKTRIQTGFGVPSFQSTCDAYAAKQSNIKYKDVSIITDGGIRYPGDFVKSIAAGADAIMCGKILAATEESPAKIVFDEIAGIYSKVYRGAASAEIQNEKRGGLKQGTCAEGVQTLLPLGGSAFEIIEEFCGGLRSGMTYCNARTLQELRDNAEFVRITSAGMLESHAFGTRKE